MTSKNNKKYYSRKRFEREISELRVANQELNLYKQLMLEKEEFLNQGTWEYNLRTESVSLSKGIYRLFGYQQYEDINISDIFEKNVNMHFDETELKRAYEDWKRIVNEADTFLREMDIISRDRVRRRIETFGKVFRDEHGCAYKVIGTSRDITKLREYELELQVKIDELNRSNSELEEFAYIASHDLHEPLRKLSTFGQRLSKNAKDELTIQNRDYLQRMLRATDNMRNLIDNLLEYSRVTRGGSTYVKTDLKKIIIDVINDHELKIEETGAVIKCSDLPNLEIIPSQIKQLFNNLLNNALKFQIQGKAPLVIFSCSILNPIERNQLRLKCHREYYKITIEDNGIGFEKSYSEKIFQIFQRLHGKTEFMGSGIGLAICRKIAENHKGLIFADSNPGKGSCFTVILPIKR